MQNKPYTFFFFSLPKDQLCSLFPKQQSCNTELADFTNFLELLKKRPNSQKKFELQAKKQMKRKKEYSCPPWPTAICKLNMTSRVCNISTGQLGLSAWLCSLPAPAHLLMS